MGGSGRAPGGSRHGGGGQEGASSPRSIFAQPGDPENIQFTDKLSTSIVVEQVERQSPPFATCLIVACYGMLVAFASYMHVTQREGVRGPLPEHNELTSRNYDSVVAGLKREHENRVTIAGIVMGGIVIPSVSYCFRRSCQCR